MNSLRVTFVTCVIVSISIRKVQSIVFHICGAHTEEVLSYSTIGEYVKEMLKDVYMVVGMKFGLTTRGKPFTVKVTHFCIVITNLHWCS